MSLKAPASMLGRRRFFHGTSNNSFGEEILKEGYVKYVEIDRIERGYSAPIQGRAYVATRPEYALIYSLGGAMIGTRYQTS